jgi:hypothetical protein
MKWIVSLLAGLCWLEMAHAQPSAIKDFVYRNRHLSVNVTMENPAFARGYPRLLNLLVKYKPGVAGRLMGRAESTLNLRNATRFSYKGQDGEPFRTVVITTDSRVVHELRLTFSKRVPKAPPELSIFTKWGALSLTHKMREKFRQSPNCQWELAMRGLPERY